MSEAMTKQSFATLLYETSAGCGQSRAVEVYAALLDRVSALESAVLEASRHILGRCDFAREHPGAYGEVSCATLAEEVLVPFVEVGPPPKYEHRLRRREVSVTTKAVRERNRTTSESRTDKNVGPTRGLHKVQRERSTRRGTAEPEEVWQPSPAGDPIPSVRGTGAGHCQMT